MKIPRFLCFLKAMREEKRIEKAAFMAELTDVACIAIADSKYATQLKNHYIESIMDKKSLEKRKNPRLFDTSDHEQAKAAANIIEGVLDLKGRLEGLT